MGSEWTDELREQAKDLYVAKEPTPENSMECVQEVAEEIDKTVNGVRMVLSRAGVYVKVAQEDKTSGTSSEPKAKRVSKAEALENLVEILKANELPIDDDILSKQTGKASVYWKQVMDAVYADEEDEE